MQTLAPVLTPGNRPALVRTLVSLVLHDSAVVGGVFVERTSLFGYRVGSGPILSREEAIDALAALLARVRRVLVEEGVDALRRLGMEGLISVRPELTYGGPRVVISIRVTTSHPYEIADDEWFALGTLRDLLRGAGLDAQRDFERNAIYVYDLDAAQRAS